VIFKQGITEAHLKESVLDMLMKTFRRKTVKIHWTSLCTCLSF